MGDTINVAGWKLDAYRANPVVFWAHDSTALPVAKGQVWRADGKLKGSAVFAPSGAGVEDMVKGGFLKATSVGFRPLSWSFAKAPERTAMAAAP